MLLEGPPLKVIAEELSFLTDNKIVSVFGSAKVRKEALEGKPIKRVFSRGKNLLFQFPGYTVRVHFVMFGSYTINNPRKNVTPSLSLKTRNTTIEFYRCSIRMIYNEEVDTLFDEEVDIMSERWNGQKVLELTLHQTDELICDVLLDQTIFAGVGNIVKNEALFLAGVHPLSRTGNIPNGKIEEIIHQARSFSKIFYQTRKKGEELNAYLKIYQKSKCPNSGEKVLRAPTGKRKRLSYVCPDMQFQY
jgi:endonuclease VIII